MEEAGARACGGGRERAGEVCACRGAETSSRERRDNAHMGCHESEWLCAVARPVGSGARMRDGGNGKGAVELQCGARVACGAGPGSSR